MSEDIGLRFYILIDGHLQNMLIFSPWWSHLWNKYFIIPFLPIKIIYFVFHHNGNCLDFNLKYFISNTNKPKQKQKQHKSLTKYFMYQTNRKKKSLVKPFNNIITERNSWWLSPNNSRLLVSTNLWCVTRQQIKYPVYMLMRCTDLAAHYCSEWVSLLWCL